MEIQPLDVEIKLKPNMTNSQKEHVLRKLAECCVYLVTTALIEKEVPVSHPLVGSIINAASLLENAAVSLQPQRVQVDPRFMVGPPNGGRA